MIQKNANTDLLKKKIIWNESKVLFFNHFYAKAFFINRGAFTIVRRPRIHRRPGVFRYRRIVICHSLRWVLCGVQMAILAWNYKMVQRSYHFMLCYR